MDFLHLILEYTYQWPPFYLSPALLPICWFILMVLSVMWLYIDDRSGDLCFASKLIIFIEAGCAVDKYQKLIQSYSCAWGEKDRDDLGMAVLAILFVGALAIYLFPLTVVVVTLYSLIRGLRFLRRLQKRVTTISQFKEE